MRHCCHGAVPQRCCCAVFYVAGAVPRATGGADTCVCLAPCFAACSSTPTHRHTHRSCNPSEDLEDDSDPSGGAVAGRLYNKHTHSYPLLFHFNGGSKALMEVVEQRLWYKALAQGGGDARGASGASAADTATLVAAGGEGARIRSDAEVMSYPVKAAGGTWQLRNLCPNFKFHEPPEAYIPRRARLPAWFNTQVGLSLVVLVIVAGAAVAVVKLSSGARPSGGARRLPSRIRGPDPRYMS